MKTDRPIEEQLDRLADEMRLHPSIQPSVMERVRSLPIQEKKSRQFVFPPWLRPAWSASLAVLFLFVGWFVLFTNSPSLYALALEAIVQAQSVYAYGERLQEDGSWQKGIEVWYHRDYGVVERSERKGIIHTRIDNKQYQWKYSTDNQIVVKSKSEDPIGLVEEILNIQKFREHFPDQPISTAIQNSETFSIYSSIQDSYRMDAWLDSQNRLRYLEEFSKNASGEWEKNERSFVEYDIPMKASFFEPSFAPDAIVKDWVKVIDASELFERFFALEKAIYQKEEYGLVFAVHEIARLENGLIFLLTSMRPGESLIQEFGPILSSKDGSAEYGNYQLDTSWKRLPDGSDRLYQPWTLAFLIHNGMRVEWSILIPKGNWPENTETVELGLYWYARGKLQERMIQEGKEWYQRIRSLTVLPLPKETGNLEDFLGDLYETGLEFEPAVSQMGFFKASVPDPEGKEGRSIRAVIKPSSLSLEQFKEECRKEYAHLK